MRPRRPVRPPKRRRRPLARLALTLAGLGVLGLGWRLTAPAAAASAEPQALAPVDAPADYVPESDDAAAAMPLSPPAPAPAAPQAPCAPLDFTRVTSAYGMRVHPILGFTRMHQGVDLAAPEGAPVLAPADGTVTWAAPDRGYGELLRIRHAGGWATGYAHLSGLAPGVAVGARVERGQVVAFVGHTGLATGPHLHFEVSFDGVRLDPMKTPFGLAALGEAQPRPSYARLRPALRGALPAA